MRTKKTSKRRGKHIALFFVDGKYHSQGIGKQLWEAMMKDPKTEHTVHSSLYAIPVYEKLGLVKTGETRTEDGITYVPMVKKRDLSR